MKDPETIFERPIDEYSEPVAGEIMPPWHQWLLYVESAKARREVPMTYMAWATLRGMEVEPDDDDAA